MGNLTDKYRWRGETPHMRPSNRLIVDGVKR
jgi:hypothetical protein